MHCCLWYAVFVGLRYVSCHLRGSWDRGVRVRRHFFAAVLKKSACLLACLHACMIFQHRPQALEAWESTVFNLGHCHRKLGNLDRAASCYLRARELSPQRHSVHSALALTHHLQVSIVRTIATLESSRSLFWCDLCLFDDAFTVCLLHCLPLALPHPSSCFSRIVLREAGWC